MDICRVTHKATLTPPYILGYEATLSDLLEFGNHQTHIHKIDHTTYFFDNTRFHRATNLPSTISLTPNLITSNLPT